MAPIFVRVPMPASDQAVVEPGSGIARRQWIRYWGYVTKIAEALAQTVGLTQERADFLESLTILAPSTPQEREWPEVTAPDIVDPIIDADAVLLVNETKARHNELAEMLYELQTQINELGERFDRVVKSQETEA